MDIEQITKDPEQQCNENSMDTDDSPSSPLAIGDNETGDVDTETHIDAFTQLQRRLEATQPTPCSPTATSATPFTSPIERALIDGDLYDNGLLEMIQRAVEPDHLNRAFEEAHDQTHDAAADAAVYGHIPGGGADPPSNAPTGRANRRAKSKGGLSTKEYAIPDNMESFLLSNLSTQNTCRVTKSHMKYVLLVGTGSEEEFRKLLVLLVSKGLKKSYVTGIFSTIRKHLRETLPNWQDPMTKITNRHMISRAFKNLDKMNSSRDYFVKDAVSGNMTRLKSGDMDRTNLVNNVGTSKQHTLIIDEVNMNKLVAFVRNSIDHYETLSMVHLTQHVVTYQFYILFIMLYTSGARFSEIMRMTMDQAAQMVEQGHVGIIGKTGRQELFIPDVVRKSLRTYMAFRREWGQGDLTRLFPATEAKMRFRFVELYEYITGKPKPDWIGFHSLRRNYSFVVSRNDLGAASVAMNHASTKTTMRYIDSNKHDANRIRKPINKTFNDIFSAHD